MTVTFPGEIDKNIFPESELNKEKFYVVVGKVVYENPTNAELIEHALMEYEKEGRQNNE